MPTSTDTIHTRRRPHAGRLALLLAAGCSALLGAVPATAAAQDTAPEATGEDAKLRALDYFDKAETALNEAGSLKASARLFAGGSTAFRGFAPSAEATLTALRVPAQTEDGEATDEHVWLYRFDGTGKDRADSDESQPFTWVKGYDTLTWLDPANERITRRPIAGGNVWAGSVVPSLDVPDLFAPTPFERERVSPGFTIEQPQEIGGVMCDVVLIEYPPITPGSSPAATSGRWFFAQNDHLPRRVERTTGKGGFAISLITELTNVQTGVDLSPDDFEVEVPEGYKLEEPTSRRTVTNQPRRVNPNTVRNDRPARPARPVAPQLQLHR